MGRRCVLGFLILCLLVAAVGQEEQVLFTGGGAEMEEADPPLVALTFDDGPDTETTGLLLDGLALREVTATFFLVGERIPGSEELVRRMAADGHQIGVHTYNHVMLTEVERPDYEKEVGRTRALLEDILGTGDYWLRPPYGRTDDRVRSWADGPLILWSVDPEDWRDRDPDRIAEAVLSRVRDGDIILMHDIYHSSVEAALRVADGLLERGFCPVTVEQLLALRGVRPEPGALIWRAR